MHAIQRAGSSLRTLATVIACLATITHPSPSSAQSSRLNLIITAESPQVKLTGNFRALDGYLAKSPRVFRAASSTDFAIFSPVLPHAGYYDVFAWWPHAVKDAGPISVAVKDAQGETLLQADQRVDAGQWIFLGQFRARANSHLTVTLRAKERNSLVVDAMRYFYRGPEAPAMELSPDSVLPAELGADYQVKLSTTGRPPFTWSIVQGRLPAGLSMDPVHGVLSGIANEPGAFEFDLEVRDANGRQVIRTLNLEVVEPGGDE